MRETRYIYRYFDTVGAKESIKQMALRFARIDALNDPSDFNPIIQFADLKPEEVRKYYEHNKHRHSYDVANTSDRELCEHYKTLKPNLEKISFIKAASKQLGVLCFSEIPDSMLLWSHYANKHQGACITFQTESSTFYQLRKRELLCNVAYQSRRPVYMVPDLGDDNRNMVSAMHIKSDVWEYEKEMRAILTLQSEALVFRKNDGHSYLKVDPQAWVDIRFGLHCKEEDKQEIIKCVQDSIPTMNIYQARLEPDSYKITFDKIDILQMQK